MTSVSAGHIILTPTQPVGSGRPQRESNLEPPHQESRAPLTELPRPQLTLCIQSCVIYGPAGQRLLVGILTPVQNSSGALLIE